MVDDGSTDDTAAVVRGYIPKIRYYRQENSGGCAVPRNTGIEQCSGEYICFMDADDLMESDRLEHQVGFMERHSGIGLSFCDYRNFTNEGHHHVSHFQTCPLLGYLLKDRSNAVVEKACAMLAKENFGIAGTLMIRRSMLASTAGFEPTLKSCEDFHFYFRLARISPVGIVNRVGMLRRLHDANMSGNSFRMLSERIRSRTMLRDTENDPKARANLDDYIALCRISLARFYADNGKFSKSLICNYQALSGRFCLGQVRTFCRTAARTILMAMGIHKPRKM